MYSTLNLFLVAGSSTLSTSPDTIGIIIAVTAVFPKIQQERVKVVSMMPAISIQDLRR